MIKIFAIIPKRNLKFVFDCEKPVPTLSDNRWLNNWKIIKTGVSANPLFTI